MKVEQKPADFLPVMITLESQDEVDKLFVLFDHSVLMEALSMQPWWEKLKEYKSEGHLKYFEIVDKLLK